MVNSTSKEEFMTSTKEYAMTVSGFSQNKATQKLKLLAEHPFDLTKEGNLTPQRLAKFTAESCGYRLLYGTERITEEVMQSLLDLAHESQALEKMQKMQSGEVMNFIQGFPSENRPALHTAVRDFFESPNTAKPAAAAAQTAKKEVEKLKGFISKIDAENKFSHLVMIGIGGSELGPHANYLALKHLLKKGRTIDFIGNTDPDNAADVLRGINLSKTLVVVVSKAGTTLETLSNEKLLRQRFIEAGLKPQEHFIAVTGEGSPMDNPKNYLEIFHIWDWVGGRFSGSSMVGGVMMAFAFGFDVYWEFLKGANAMDKAALNQDVNKNIPLLGALLEVWNHNFLGYPTLAVVPYSYALSRYSAHLQQVEMESNGKRIDQRGQAVDFQTGPIIWGEPGNNAQHSFYQLIHQGTATVPVELIGFKQDQYQQDLKIDGTTLQEKLLGNLFAQMIALATGKKDENPNKVFPGNRPSHVLLAKRLTPFTLGALFAYFEHKVVFEGFIWGINSFDQEGVQLGKVLAKKIIERLAGEGDSYPLGDAFLKHLETL